MKIALGDAERFCAKPPDALPGALLFGDDGALIRLRREVILKAALGEGATEDFRLDEITAATLRSDPAALDDALRAQSMFGGKRGVVVSEAADGLTKLLTEALRTAAETGTLLLVLAGALPAASRLRKLFESSKSAAAIQCRQTAPDRAALAELLGEQGIAAEPDALGALEAAMAGLDAMAVRGAVERITLYKLGDAAPLDAAEVELLTAAAGTAEIEHCLGALAARQPAALRQALGRLWGQGVSPHAVATAAARRFSALHAASASPDGPEVALSRQRPPLFGPRRTEAARQAGRWGVKRLEVALAALHALNDRLRGAGGPSPEAVTEQVFLDLATRRF